MSPLLITPGPTGSRHASKRSASGFTLLELILAMAITGVLSVVLFTSLSAAFNTRQRTEDHLAGRNTLRITMNLLRADLQCVPMPTTLLTGEFVGEDDLAVIGRDADLITYTTANIGLATGEEISDLREIRLSLVEDPETDDQRLLIREVQPHLLASVTPDPIVQVLARRVVSFNARYYDGTDWTDQWASADQENALPHAVELTLKVRPERHRVDEAAKEDDDLLTLVQIIELPAAEDESSDGSQIRF